MVNISTSHMGYFDMLQSEKEFRPSVVCICFFDQRQV